MDCLEHKYSSEAKSGKQSAFMTSAKQIYGNIDKSLPSNNSAENGNTSSISQERPCDKSYIKIFAILVLIGRPARIKLFIDEDICDADLPLIKKLAEGRFRELCRKSAPEVQLRCFEGWDHLSMKEFEAYQWKLLAPSFERGSRRHIHHYAFDSKVILPFTYYSQRSESGTFGQVSKVKIHPDYHKFSKDAVCLPPAHQSFFFVS